MWISGYYNHPAVSPEGEQTMPVASAVRDTDLFIVSVQCEMLSTADNAALILDILADTCTDVLAEFAVQDFITSYMDSSDKNEVQNLQNFLLNRICDRLSGELAVSNISREQAQCTFSFVYISKLYNNALICCLGSSVVCIVREHGADIISQMAATPVFAPNAAQRASLCFLKISDVMGFMLLSGTLDGSAYSKTRKTLMTPALSCFNNAGSNALLNYAQKQFDAVSGYYSVSVLSQAEGIVSFPADKPLAPAVKKKPQLPKAPNYHVPSRTSPEPAPVKQSVQQPVQTTPAAPSAQQPVQTTPAPPAAQQQMQAPATRRAPYDAVPVKSGELPEKKDVPGNKYKLIALVACIVAVVSLTAAVIAMLTQTGRRSSSGAENDDVTEATEGTTAPQEVFTLSDGGKFWGDSKNGIPDGKGVLLRDGKYYIGYFVDGKPRGTFSVISDDGTYIGSYSTDNTAPPTTSPSETEAPTTSPRHESSSEAGEEPSASVSPEETVDSGFSEGDTVKLLSFQAYLRSQPSENGEKTAVISGGNLLNVEQSDAVSSDNKIWILVSTASGDKGWIPSDSVVRSVANR